MLFKKKKIIKKKGQILSLFLILSYFFTYLEQFSNNIHDVNATKQKQQICGNLGLIFLNSYDFFFKYILTGLF